MRNLIEEFSKSRSMVFPRNVLVGHDALDDLGDLAAELDLRGTATVVTGPTTRKVAGERTASILDAAGYPTRLLEVERATLGEVSRVEAAVDDGDGFVLGVGGGSVIDVAKLASHRVDQPFVSVPTSASHDGLTSPRASIKGEGGSSSRAAQAPLAIVADTNVIVGAPHRMLASGCADAISNYTAVLDWQLAHRLRKEAYSSFAAVLAQTAAEILISNADDIKPGLEEAAWLVVKALIVSGVSMSVAGSSRPASGAEHMFSHTLDILAPGRAYHGEQVGVGSILMMYLHGGDWEMVRDALRAVGAPTTAEELGIPAETIVEALTKAHENKPERYTILGTSGISHDAALELVRVTGVA